MECIPCVRVVVETAALPALIVTGAPICVTPSKKVSVPVSVPAAAEVAVAVNITLCPRVTGLSDDATVVDVAAVTPALTVCKIPDDVVAAKLASPLYMQKIEWFPCASEGVVNVALAAAKVTAGPSGFPLSRKVTLPVGMPGVADVIVAVKVTACPTIEGFGEEAIVAKVVAPVEAVAVPAAGIINGLPGALVVTKIAPPL